MVLHAHSLVKADATPALYAELSSNNIDLCFVSESWLNKKILSHLICPDGYVMVRKDQNGIRAGGGAAVICRKDWKIKAINANGQFEFETLWCKITTPNSEFFAASVFHPPDPISKLLCHTILWSLDYVLIAHCSQCLLGWCE